MEESKTLIAVVAVVAIVAIFSMVISTKQKTIAMPMIKNTMEPIATTQTEPSTNMTGQAFAKNDLCGNGRLEGFDECDPPRSECSTNTIEKGDCNNFCKCQTTPIYNPAGQHGVG